MGRASVAACIVPLLAAAPAAAQAPDSTAQSRHRLNSIVAPALPPANEGVSLPVVSYTAPDGVLTVRRGIVAGFNVAPNALIGIGLFKMMPKRASPGFEPMDKAPSKSRKAAVGFTLNF